MVTRAIVKFVTVTVPTLGIIEWAAMKHVPALSAAIAKKF
jgi:hypothetical protein